MIHPLPRHLMLAALCLLASATACSDDDDSNPNADILNQLRECGLLSDGEIGDVEIDDDSRCLLECAFAKGCADTSLFICGPTEEEGLPDFNELTDECLDACNLSFTCGDGQVLDSDFRCDGFPDCSDGTDELGCSDAMFRCGSGEMLPQDARCNYRVECPDGSDEYGCDGFTCQEDGSVIAEARRCDGAPDCARASDEVGCDTFTCNSGGVVPATARCNLVQECPDGSDEYGCAQIVCDEPDTCTNPTADDCLCTNSAGQLCTQPDAPGCTCVSLEGSPVGQFGSCDSALDCGAGQTCFSTSGNPPGQCVLICRDNPSICPGGTTCINLGAESICLESEEPPEDDFCFTEGLYGDGFCDDFCPRPDPDCATETQGYAFVLVEDLSINPTGEGPGADIDAISVTISGVETFATAVADFSLGGGSFLDPTQATGAPDSSCQVMNFVSLGGDGGYLMVEFGSLFDSGDSVTVYELGPTACPNQPQWIDDDYRVSVSISTSLGGFTEIGIGGAGINTLVVP